jgi:hypothetical protein
MKCPYCGGEMQHGEIFGDGRMKVCWVPENRYNISIMDKLLSADMHRLKNVTYKSGFWIQADYCKACKKMIFETDIT